MLFTFSYERSDEKPDIIPVVNDNKTPSNSSATSANITILNTSQTLEDPPSDSVKKWNFKYYEVILLCWIIGIIAEELRQVSSNII
jgi:hypothetical protein